MIYNSSNSGVADFIGGQTGGTVVALAASPDFARDGTFFAATMVGLYRSQDQANSWQQVGESLPGPSLSAVAASPGFAHDRVVLVANLEGGIFRSADGGHTWTGSHMMPPGDTKGRPGISALAISADFTRDGTAFAGTMGAGVFLSRDRCDTWEPCNFGLLDLNVLDLAISPAFGQDQTIFAATTSGVFRSRNGGRAWREVDFPFEAAPVQCLACSPGFAEDGFLFAGTEDSGIFRSTDWGRTWQLLPALPESLKLINGLVLSPAFTADRTVLAATESDVYVSRAAGDTWSRCVALSGVLCLGLAPTFPSGGPVLVGLSRAGIYRSDEGLAGWKPANEGFYGRVLAGLALSPSFATDRRAFAFGPGEGVIRSVDGGVTWLDTSTGLPSLGVDDLAITPAPNGETHLYAALAEGVWRSRQWGETWEHVSDLPAQRLALSPRFPRDPILIVGTKGRGLWVSPNGGQSWQPVEFNGDGQQVLALVLSPAFPEDGQVFVTVSRPGNQRAEVWRGEMGGPWRRVISHQGVARSAALVVPPAYPLDGRWLAALDDQVFRLLGDTIIAHRGGRRPAFSGRALAYERPTIIDLAALPEPRMGHLVAATGRGVYFSTDRGAEWIIFRAGLSARPVVAVVPSSDFAQDGAIYALELSGKIWRVVFPHEC